MGPCFRSDDRLRGGRPSGIRKFRTEFQVAKPDRHGMLGVMPGKTSDTQDQSAEAPHYHGHRERLRERFHGAGPDALSDYELLEMVLFSAKARGDVKPLAKTLLKKFGSSAEVMHAPEMRLREVPE